MADNEKEGDITLIDSHLSSLSSAITINPSLIISLNLHSNNLKSLDGLKALVNLTSLNISSNQITKITCLSFLPKLKTLNLAANMINDIHGLREISSTTLICINLAHNNIAENVEEIFHENNSLWMAHLEEFDLRDNMIANTNSLPSLKNMPNLKKLWLQVRNGQQSNPICKSIPNYYVHMLPFPPSLLEIDGFTIIEINNNLLTSNKKNFKEDVINNNNTNNKENMPKFDAAANRFYKRTIDSIEPMNERFTRLSALANAAKMEELENKLDRLVVGEKNAEIIKKKKMKEMAVQVNFKQPPCECHKKIETLSSEKDNLIDKLAKMEGEMFEYRKKMEEEVELWESSLVEMEEVVESLQKEKKLLLEQNNEQLESLRRTNLKESKHNEDAFNDYENKVKALKREVESLKERNDEINLTLESKESFIKTISSRLASVESTISLKNVDLNKFESANEELVKRIEDEEALKKKAIRDLQYFQTNSEEKINQLQNQLCALEYQIKCLKTDLQQEKVNSSSSSSEVTRLQGEIAAMERNQREVSLTHEKIVSSLHNQINSVSTNQQSEVQKVSSEHNARFATLENAFQQAAKKNAEYKELLKSFVAKHKKQTNVLTQLNDLMAQQKDKIDELSSARTKDSILFESKLNEEIEKIKSEYKKEKIEDRENFQKSMKEVIASNENKIKLLNCEISKLEGDLINERNKHLKEIEDMKEGNNALAQENVNKSNKLQSLLQKEDDLLTAVKVKDAMLDDQAVTIKDFRSKILNLESDYQLMNKKYERRLEELKHALEEETSYRHEQEDKIDSQEEIISHLEGIIDELKSSSKVEELKSKLKEKDEILAFVDNEVKSVTEMFKKKEENLIIDQKERYNSLLSKLQENERKLEIITKERESAQSELERVGRESGKEIQALKEQLMESKNQNEVSTEQLKKLLNKIDRDKVSHEKKLKQVQLILKGE